MEKIDNHHETFYSVNNAVTYVTLVHTSYFLLLRNEILTCVELYSCEIIFRFIQQVEVSISSISNDLDVSYHTK